MLKRGRVYAVVVNPRAGAVRRHPELPRELEARAGQRARICVTRDPDHLAETARQLAAEGVSHVGVVGGDGTASATLSALFEAYGSRALPRLSFLRGGTMNTIATSLGAKRGTPLSLLTGMLNEAASPPREHLMQRPCLQIGKRLGFLFGTGVMAGYLDTYNHSNGGHPTPLTAVRVLAQAAGSAMVDGPTIHSILNETELEIRHDGGSFVRAPYVTVGAATVPHIGLGFRLFFRAYEAMDRFHLVAVRGSPAAVASELPRVFAGLGLSSKVSQQALTAHAELRCPAGAFSYFIDGDLFRAHGVLKVGLGPTWSFLHPKPI